MFLLGGGICITYMGRWTHGLDSCLLEGNIGWNQNKGRVTVTFSSDFLNEVIGLDTFYWSTTIRSVSLLHKV